MRTWRAQRMYTHTHTHTHTQTNSHTYTLRHRQTHKHTEDTQERDQDINTQWIENRHYCIFNTLWHNWWALKEFNKMESIDIWWDDRLNRDFRQGNYAIGSSEACLREWKKHFFYFAWFHSIKGGKVNKLFITKFVFARIVCVCSSTERLLKNGWIESSPAWELRPSTVLSVITFFQLRPPFRTPNVLWKCSYVKHSTSQSFWSSQHGWVVGATDVVKIVKNREGCVD